MRKPAHPVRLAAMLLCGVFGWLVFQALFRGTWGQDWMVFDSAARLWLRGDTADILDGARLTQIINAGHKWLGAPLVFRPWVYPPYTLLLALPFGAGPWWWSYGGFLALSFAGMACALRLWLPAWRRFLPVLLGVALCPASAYTLGAGQNSFLSAGLLLAGIWWLDRRPLLAGALLALMAYKPQLALLLPAALIGAGAWRAVASAIATFVALVAVSLVVPGLALWRGFLALYLHPGDAPRHWVELYGQSIYTCLHLLGVPENAANGAQILALLLASAAVWAVFRRGGAMARLRVLLVATGFAAPHFGDYDAVLLAIAAMLELTGAAVPPVAASLAAAAWCSTAFNPPLLYLKTLPVLFPLAEATPLVLGAWLLICVRRNAGLARREDGVAAALGAVPR